MKNNEILLLAIKKAQKNGFKLISHKHFTETKNDEFTGEILSIGAYESIIYDHDFAKAFWAEEDPVDISTFDYDRSTDNYQKSEDYIEAWKYHLQQMVLTENPLKYLEQFL